MRSLFFHDDGRMKTFQVSLVVFALVLLSGAALFRMSQPVENTLVRVRHIFEPPPAETPIEATDSEPEPDTPSPEPTAVTPSSSTTAPVAVGTTEESAVEVPASEARSSTERLVSGETTYVEDSPQPESSANPAPEASKPAAPANAHSDPSKPETDDAFQEHKSEVASLAITAGDPPEKPVKNQTAETASPNEVGMVKTGRNHTKTSTAAMAAEASEQVSADREKDDATREKFPDREQQAVSSPTHDARQMASRKLELEPDNYQRIFNHWRTLGTSPEGVSTIPLRVSNLKSVHRLFQMKPVAVVTGDKYVDLSDGTRIPEASLDVYSQTVFRVDAPWSRWGSELKAAGLRRKQVVEVRYYMYDFVRNAIYLRARQSVAWGKRQGHIPAETAEQDVDVLGRAFELSRKGGGRFGVFVPMSLTLTDGRIVPVDPLCFKGEADVDALRTAGIF